MKGFEMVPTWQNDPEEVEEARRKDREFDVEAVAGWIFSMLKHEKILSERIPLNRDRTFDIPGNVTELPTNVAQLVRSAKQMEYSQSGLYEFAKDISKKFPELRFSFKVDPKGAWIEYSVQQQHLTVGDEVVWVNQGAVQWSRPRKITAIHEDPAFKRKYAFVEGGTTGIPLDELTPNQTNV